jgi:hypothetical protein
MVPATPSPTAHQDERREQEDHVGYMVNGESGDPVRVPHGIHQRAPVVAGWLGLIV